MAVDADNSKITIYKIYCLDENIKDIYVGQTTDFNGRKRSHKFYCNNENYTEYNQKLYQFIRNNGGFENWNMIQIEEYQFNNKREANARETYWMKELKSTLNSRQSFTTEEERKEQYKNFNQTEKRKEYNKLYKQTDKFKEQRKVYKRSKKYREYENKYRQTKALYLNELKCYNL